MRAAESVPYEGVGVYFIDLALHRSGLESEEVRTPRLAHEEECRAAAIRDVEWRQLWRASHIALRIVLELWDGQALRRTPYVRRPGGKPQLAGSITDFSLSHSGNSALIAVSRTGLIGADLEAVRRRDVPEERRSKIEALARELAGGLDLPEIESRRFLQAWTRIEAAAKVEGQGVLRSLREGGANAAGGIHPGQGQNLRSLEVRDLDVGGGFCAALAGRDLPAIVKVVRFPSFGG